ncbi:retropepsin-like aspartic protease family protein [Thiohalomonas denitrificans]|uniref:Clan AA aspartic protease, TIGR02281 family n=1 Tax=Thiohalomonas denitrificans TaxID=415747 RepID=A0A1G5Q639_9GAMM|nr:retropepsin-like aspartic protease [Thiohalomonas denitrificans]SCZ57323.1 clan AA aspartic protease, TIGR02281 family [Thiohalomonas denitrificans]
MKSIMRHPVLSLLVGIATGILIFAARAQAPAEFATAVPLHDKGISTYYVRGSIDGLGDVEFLVDTGAGHTTINEETLTILKERQLASYSRDLTGILADGSRMRVPVYHIASIELGGCQLQNIEAAVFPGRTRFLLGMNALKQAAPFAFVTEPKPQLALSNCRMASK